MFGLRLMLLALAVPLVLSYDEKYDKIDVDKIIGDDALLDAYINCLLDKGPCTVEHSTEFRKIIPEVIAEACAKCTAVQRQNIRKSIKVLQERKPEAFKEFKAKYDPKDEYQKAFTEFMMKTD